MKDAPSDELLYEVRGQVGVVTFNRPAAHNALTFEMYDRLGEICASVPEDRSVRAIVVTGAGGRAFGAGTDISLFRDFSTSRDGIDYEARMEAMFAKLERCPVPIIAAIPGICTGGAAVIAATCDLRIATRNFKFGFPIARTLANCLSAPNIARVVLLNCGLPEKAQAVTVQNNCISSIEAISAAALANNNTGGVPGGLHYFCPGTGASDPAAVLTGFEVAIDLADLGYGNGPGQVPFVAGSSPLNFAVFLNGTGHGKVANQMLQHGCVDDLGEPRDVDFQAIQGNQYVGFPTPVAAPAVCVAPTLNGDANHDGMVSFADVTAVLANFGAMYPPGSGGTGDANNDGTVNFADVTAILANFGAMGLTC